MYFALVRQTGDLKKTINMVTFCSKSGDYWCACGPKFVCYQMIVCLCMCCYSCVCIYTAGEKYKSTLKNEERYIVY